MARRVDAIFYETNGFTDNRTLTDLLPTHPEELPAIKRAWDYQYRLRYGMTFDAMLGNELSAEVAENLRNLANK